MKKVKSILILVCLLAVSALSIISFDFIELAHEISPIEDIYKRLETVPNKPYVKEEPDDLNSYNISKSIKKNTYLGIKNKTSIDMNKSVPIDEFVEVVVNDSNNFQDRYFKSSDLKDELPADQQRIYLAYLKRTNLNSGKSLAENSIRNDVLENLLFQKKMLPELGAEMLSMFYNKEHQPVWRDYVLQHFVMLFEEKYKLNPNGFLPYMEVYKEALADQEHDFAGTALLSLFHFRNELPDIGINIYEEALRLAKTPSISDANLVAAIQVLSNYKNEYVEDLITFICNNKTSYTVKLLAKKVLKQFSSHKVVD